MKVLVYKKDDREVMLDTLTQEVIVRLTSGPRDEVVVFPVKDLIAKYVQFCRPTSSMTKR